MPIDTLLDLPFLAVLAAANAVPALIAKAIDPRWSTPIDFGLRLPDGRPLFGPHKTWRGLAVGVAAAAIVGAVTSIGMVPGAACGMLSLYGDLAFSFLKRRIGLASGTSVPLLDQVAEATLPLVVLIQRESGN